MKNLLSQRKIKKNKFVLFILSTIIAIFVVATINLPIINTPSKQYKLLNSKKYVKKDATRSADFKKQTLAEFIDKKYIEKSKITETPKFAKWSILENFQAGYRLIYPAGFKIDYDSKKVEVTPPSGPGIITVMISDKTFKTSVDLEGADSNQKELLQAANQLINDSFEFIAK